MDDTIEIGYKAYTHDGGEEFGAVREVSPDLVIYVENAGEFVVARACVESVHAQKVIVRFDKLEPALQQAIRHAHDAEEPGL